LGWVVERAAGKRFSDLVSELIWQPMGAMRSGYVTVDRLGAPRAAGGMCVTTSDLARLGQLLVQRGTRDGKQIIPSGWIEDIVTAGDPAAWNKGPFTPFFPGEDMHYRAKCYVTRGKEPVIMGLGVHGQYLVADLANEVVIAKHSSEAMPLDAENILLTMRGFKAIRAFTAKG
jgi:CubicO group peptidase (beta-lactamase class C family)